MPAARRQFDHDHVDEQDGERRPIRDGGSGSDSQHRRGWKGSWGTVVLQAWVQRGKRVESAKTLFVPNRDGTATAVIDDMEGVNTVMVTAEPHGGSDYPTSEPIVSLAVPQ